MYGPLQTPGQPQSHADLALSEHKPCHDAIAAVDVLVNSTRTDWTNWALELQFHLGVLIDTLARHFQREEESHLFTDFALGFPHHADRVDRLRQEHSALMGRLRGLLAAIGERDAHTQCAQVRAALTTLRRHEAEENEIITTAYWDDTGGRG